MIRRLGVSSLALLFVACTFEPRAETEGEQSETGEQAEAVTLVVEADPSAICGEFGGAIELVTRRVDCWDPQLPCTLAQDPPWVVGTTDDCSTLVPGVTRWEVTVGQTGRWETRLQAGGQLACFGLDGEPRTNVANADLAAAVELQLAPAPAGECGEP